MANIEHERDREDVDKRRRRQKKYATMEFLQTTMLLESKIKLLEREKKKMSHKNLEWCG